MFSIIERMFRAVSILILLIACGGARAHLNHMQFAAIDERDGQLHIRYRMSADMFMTNLELEIKDGKLPAEIKDQPIDKIIAAYFDSHLMLLTLKQTLHILETRFTLEDNTGDWIADFTFPISGDDFTLFCDAFLAHNPRTQTLARCDWKGRRDVFHFKTGAERWEFRHASVILIAYQSQWRLMSLFLPWVAHGLTCYGLIAIGALVCLALRKPVILTACIFSFLATFLQPAVVFETGMFLALFAATFTCAVLLRKTVALIQELNYA